MAPQYVAEFIRAFHIEVNRQLQLSEIAAGLKRKELEEVNRRLDKLLDAITDGLRAPGLQARLDELEGRKAALQQELNGMPASPPRFHPRLAEIYQEKVATLHAALADSDEREGAFEILRSLMEKINVRPSETDRSFEIELVGEIANMIALLPGAEGATKEPYRSSLKVVAGEGLEPPTLGL